MRWEGQVPGDAAAAVAKMQLAELVSGKKEPPHYLVYVQQALH